MDLWRRLGEAESLPLQYIEMMPQGTGVGTKLGCICDVSLGRDWGILVEGISSSAVLNFTTIPTSSRILKVEALLSTRLHLHSRWLCSSTVREVLPAAVLLTIIPCME
jgi:hypothetical protein